MKYGKLIVQAWQILKRTKLLWLFGIIYFLTYYAKIKRTDILALECVSALISGLSLFLVGFSLVGMILCTDKVIHGESPSFKEIWLEYKVNLGRLILLFLAFLIPCGIIFLCAYLSLGLTNTLFSNAANDITLRIWLASWISGPFISGIITFSYYGLILHKLGILKSVRHGLSVFSLNWFKFFVLYLCLESPVLLSYLILWLILLSAGPVTLLAVFQAAAEFPALLWFRAINSFFAVFSSATFLLAYYQFIKDFDYPTLRQVTRKT